MINLFSRFVTFHKYQTDRKMCLFLSHFRISLSRSLFSRILLSVSPFVSVFLYLFYLCASARMWNPFSYWLRCEFNFLFGFIQPSIHSDRSIVCYCGCCCWVFFFLCSFVYGCINEIACLPISLFTHSSVHSFLSLFSNLVLAQSKQYWFKYYRIICEIDDRIIFSK